MDQWWPLVTTLGAAVILFGFSLYIHTFENSRKYSPSDGAALIGLSVTAIFGGLFIATLPWHPSYL